MVSKTEETQLSNLEIQVDNGGGGAWEYLCLVRKLKVRRSEKVLKHGLSILNDPKKRSSLGHDEWTLYEQVAIAAMDCQCIDVAKDCIKILQKRFPGSKRVGRLEALLLEAMGSWEEADNAYSSLLEDHPIDQAIHKRRVALAKAQGNMSGAIELLNKYLEIFMADHDAWRELAEIYASLQMYKQAAFCYEELILSQPMVPQYHLAYADDLKTTKLIGMGHEAGGLYYLDLPPQSPRALQSSTVSPLQWHSRLGHPSLATLKRQVAGLQHVSSLECEACQLSKHRRVSFPSRIVLYTLGGLENLQNAKKYYASTIDLTGGKNTRALFGICLCSSAMGQLSKGRNKDDKESPELQSLAATVLERDYKQRAPDKLSLLTTALKSLKVSS